MRHTHPAACRRLALDCERLRGVRRRGLVVLRPALARERARLGLVGVDVAPGRELQGGHVCARRPAEHDDDADRQRRRRPDRPLLDRLHGRRRRGAAVLRLHVLLRLLDAAAGRGRQPADAAGRVGPRRPLVLPADRLLARAADGDRGGEEGLRDECLRRRHDGARVLRPDRALELARLRDLVRHRRGPLPDNGRPRRARPAGRRGGEVGADPPAHVAAGRDGGPDAGERAHPCRDDGDGRRLPDRAHAPHLRADAHDPADRRRHGHADAARGGPRRSRADRHQAGDRVLDDVADRLHVPGRRHRRVCQRHVPPDDARLLQGAAVPGGRRPEPHARRRAGHPEDERHRSVRPVDAARVPHRLARARGGAAVRRLLLEGLDHRRGVPRPLVRGDLLGRRAHRDVPDRPLHLPALLHRLPRRAECLRTRAPPRARRRGPDDDAGAGLDPRRALRRRRVDPVRAALAPPHQLARAGGADARRGRAQELGRSPGVGARRRARARRHRGGLPRVRAPPRRGAEPARRAARARAQALLRRGLRHALLPAGGRARDVVAPRLRGAGRAGGRARPRRDGDRRRPRRAPHPDGPAAHLRPLPRRGHGSGRDRLPDGAMTTSTLTSVLIWLPIGAALVIWVLPLSRYATGSLALRVSLLEVGIWIEQAARFDFNQGGLQFSTKASWIDDLNVSYHVGEYAFSLWLVGLTVVAMAACVGYGFWVGRDRPRAYFGLMLFLTGATVGVFVAQDLLLFYAFFEAMLIPLYILVGVWGGPCRFGATVKFVIYTMAGSLIMLAAVIVLGIQQGTFDLVSSGTSGSTWIFLGFVAAFAVKAPLFPFHGWLPDAYREAPAEVSAVLSGVVSKAAVYGLLRIAIAKFPGPTHDVRVPILVFAAIGLVYGSLVAFRAPDVRGVIAYSSLAQMGLIVLGFFAGNNLGFDGAILQSVNHGLLSATLFLLAGGIERRAATGELSRLGGMARGRPVLATLLVTTGIIALAVPGSTAFAGEFAILSGVFFTGWGWAVVGAVAIVLAAMYMLRLISAVLHVSPGPAVSEAALDLRSAELGFLVPLVACLLALSAWPAAVSHRSFNGIPFRAAPTHLSASDLQQAMAQLKASDQPVITIYVVQARTRMFTVP